MPIASEQGQKAALADLEIRRERSRTEGQIDNASLHAGSPMYYYCRYCGVLTDTLPEDWYQNPPKQICAECEDLRDHGWHDEIDFR